MCRLVVTLGVNSSFVHDHREIATKETILFSHRVSPTTRHVERSKSSPRQERVEQFKNTPTRIPLTCHPGLYEPNARSTGGSPRTLIAPFARCFRLGFEIEMEHIFGCLWRGHEEPPPAVPVFVWFRIGFLDGAEWHLSSRASVIGKTLVCHVSFVGFSSVSYASTTKALNSSFCMSLYACLTKRHWLCQNSRLPEQTSWWVSKINLFLELGNSVIVGLHQCIERSNWGIVGSLGYFSNWRGQGNNCFSLQESITNDSWDRGSE